MRHTQTLVQHIRRVAREEVANAGPTVERYQVVSLKPFTLEAFGSDIQLVDGQPDFDLAPGIRRRAKVGDTVLVATDVHGDHMAISEAAGVAASNPSKHGPHGRTGKVAEEEGGEGEAGTLEGEEGVEEASPGEQAQAAVTSAGLGVINHGNDGGVARPEAFAVYVWIGEAEPTNAKEHDFWTNAL